ncbi:acetylglutamate kinase [Eupransor demetentiae]|uniref:acetylglutamate kinase n=1 Tax=Eupransor demetentiae TaxID=3109584 RepID=A0ABP0EQY7_9LACO|nr:N-acetylglutamate kinase (ArgB) [Lactobacillaceae bacterium LMG 33000]
MNVIKIGGNAIPALNEQFYQQLAEWTTAGQSVLIVHGGGLLISQVADFFHQVTEKIDGIRKTDAQMLELTQGVLADLVQPFFASQLEAHGLEVTRLNSKGKIPLQADYLDQALYGEVGKVTGWDEDVFTKLPAGKIALLASLGQGPAGQILNINADAVAQEVAILAKAEELILLTDVAGLKIDGQVLKQASPSDIQDFITAKEITGGMIPKVTAACEVLHAGVQSVRITDQINHPGTLLAQSKGA